MQHVDIIGGGIAGLALGTGLLRRGIPVTVHDAGGYPRHRTCGEFINGLMPGALEALGLAGVLRDAPRLRHVTWKHGNARSEPWELTRPALVMSRADLDARLAETFCRHGGELVTRSTSALQGAAGRVFATGRRPDTESPWFGLKLHLEDFPLEADLEFHVGRGAYAGVCRLGHGRANLCGLFHRRAHRGPRDVNPLAPELEAAGMGELAARVASATVVPGTRCAVAGLRFGVQPAIANSPSVGDAFAFFPPFTGRGIASAFAGAACAVAPLAAWAGGTSGWSEALHAIHHAQMHLHRGSLRRATVLHRFLLSPKAARFATFLLHTGALPLRRINDILDPPANAACFSIP